MDSIRIEPLRIFPRASTSASGATRIIAGHAVDAETDERGDQKSGVHFLEQTGDVLVARFDSQVVYATGIAGACDIGCVVKCQDYFICVLCRAPD